MPPGALDCLNAATMPGADIAIAEQQQQPQTQQQPHRHPSNLQHATCNLQG